MNGFGIIIAIAAGLYLFAILTGSHRKNKGGGRQRLNTWDKKFE